jgi:hypothetical protein
MSGRLLRDPKFIVTLGVVLYVTGVVGFVGSVVSILQNLNPTWFAFLGALSVCLLFVLKIRAMEIRRTVNSH